MSYDLILSHRAYDSDDDFEIDDMEQLAASLQVQARNQHIGEALAGLGLEVYFDDAGIPLEAFHEDDGLQVELYPDEIAVSVAYWHEGENAQRVFEKMGAVVALLVRITDFPVYDVQLGQQIDMERDLDAMLQAYLHTVARFKGE